MLVAKRGPKQIFVVWAYNISDHSDHLCHNILHQVLTLRLCPNIFMLHPYLGMQPRARAGGICCTISLPANQNDLPFAVLPRMIKRFFNRFIGEEYEYADLVLLVDIFLCNSRASNTCLTLFQKFKKTFSWL